MLRSLRDQPELETDCFSCLSYRLEDDWCEVLDKAVAPDSKGCGEWRENLLMRDERYDLFNMKV